MELSPEVDIAQTSHYVMLLQERLGRKQLARQSKAKLSMDAQGKFWTDVDVDIESEAREELLKIVPGSSFMGEETGTLENDGRYGWIEDGTDGTSLFKMGGGYWSHSTALVDRHAAEPRKKVVLGSIHQPSTGQTFYFGHGVRAKDTRLGDWSNIPVSPSQTIAPAEFLGCAFGTSPYYAANPGIEARLANVFAKEEHPQLKRKYGPIDARPGSGSSARFCTDIAMGNRHFALLFFQKPWDLAAGAIYAQRAGCIIEMYNNNGSVIQDADLETSIATAKHGTLLNVGIYANAAVMTYVQRKFNAEPQKK